MDRVLPGRAPDGQGAAAGADPRRRGADAARTGVRRGRAAARRPRRGARPAHRPGRAASGSCSPRRRSCWPRPGGRCTTLSLFGYRVDGVVANRVFPAEGADDWRAGWVPAQAEVLAEVDAVVRRAAGLALAVPRPRAGRGRGARRRWPRELYGGDDPLALPAGDGPVPGHAGAATASVLRLALPLRLAGRRRPGPQRRRAGGDRRVVPAAARAARRAGPATRVAGARVGGRGAAGAVRGDAAAVNERVRREPAGRGLWRRQSGAWPRRPPSCSARSPTGRATSGRRRSATGVAGSAGRRRRRPRDGDQRPHRAPAPRSAATARSAGPSTWCERRAPRSATTWRPPASASCRLRRGCSAAARPRATGVSPAWHIDLDERPRR